MGPNSAFLLGGRTSASAECRHWSGRAVRWFDFAQRAALHAVAPHLQASEQQNLELQNRLACEARARLDAAVERAGLNYREIDQDPGGTTGFGRLIHYRDVFDKCSWTRLSPSSPPTG